MIELALVNLLVERAGVGTRVAPTSEVDPQPPGLPRIAYTLISSPRDYCDDGPTLDNPRFQVDVYAARRSEAMTVVRRIMAGAADDPPGLDGYRGTRDGVEILRAWFDGYADDDGDQDPGKNSTVARCTVDVRFVYRDAPAGSEPDPGQGGDDDPPQDDGDGPEDDDGQQGGGGQQGGE